MGRTRPHHETCTTVPLVDWIGPSPSKLVSEISALFCQIFASAIYEFIIYKNCLGVGLALPRIQMDFWGREGSEKVKWRNGKEGKKVAFSAFYG